MNSLIVTDRDVSLLYDCYHHATLSVSQIRHRHFPERSKAAAHNRLSRLKDAGLIRSFQVGTVLYHDRPQKIGVVYQVTKKGIEHLRERKPHEPFRDEPIRLSTTSLPHDLLLTEVVSALHLRFPQRRIITGSAHGRIESAKRTPDALILNEMGRPDVAIELELTAKTKKRYREIVLQYKLAPQFPKVLYIAGSKSIQDKVRFAVTERRDNPLLPVQSTGKFYFVLMATLLQNPRAAPVTNGALALQL